MKNGFTLAEVLITLTIVGVISTLTVPNVIQSTNKKIYVSQLQRTYNILRNAFAKYMLDNETDTLYNTGLGFGSSRYAKSDCPQSVIKEACEGADHCPKANAACHNWVTQSLIPNVESFFLKYMDVTVNCTHDNYLDCVAGSYSSLVSEDPNDAALEHPRLLRQACVVLNTGASVCYGPAADAKNNAQLFIDVNGKKGPNTYGRDVFWLKVNNSGQIGEGFTLDGFPTPDISPEDCGTPDEKDMGCFTKIVADGWQMNY